MTGWAGVAYSALDATGIAILAVDDELRLCHFTPAAAELFGLRESDRDRALSDLSCIPGGDSLAEATQEAFNAPTRVEPRLWRTDGKCMICRIAPWQDIAAARSRVLMSFLEITSQLNTDAEQRCLAEVLMDSRDAITIQDSHGRITAWNRGAHEMYGYSRTEALHMKAQDLVPPGEREHNRLLLEKTARGEMVEPFETRRVTRDGREIDVWLTATRLGDGNDELGVVATTERDISARKRLEQQLMKLNRELELRVAERTAEVERNARELREREQRLSAIVATAPDAIITIGRDTIIDSFNPAAERMFGYTAAEAVGMTVATLVPPLPEEQEPFVERFFASAQSSGWGRPQEVRGKRKDGTLFPMELNVTPIDHQGLFIAIARDMSEKRALEKQIIEVSTQEQERIGHEIHDGLGQQLSALTMMATSLQRKFADKTIPDAAHIRALVDHLQNAAEEAHALSLGLAPVPMDPKGLEAALEKLTDHVGTAAGVACHLAVSHPVAIENRTLAMQLYRIAQEAVNNAVKHAQARNINVDLTTDSNGVTLTVRDDGKGMTPGKDNPDGLGMHIMRYRANIIGATLRIRSTPSEGTTVSCSLAYVPG